MTANQSDNAVRCQVCGHSNLAGTLLCNNCGAMLISGIRGGGTRNLTEELPEFRSNTVFTASGSSEFKPGMSLRMAIEGWENEITVDPNRRSLLVGRRDTMSQHTPDIDMEDYEGYRLGVSRKHAQFATKERELTIQDFGSANGTYLNGVRLPAHRPHKLHDGDEIRLGNLTLRVYFV